MVTAETAGDRYKWVAFAAVGSFLLTGVFAITAVFLSLPAIAEDFGVTLKDVSWVILIRSVTVSALLVPFGRLSDLVGRRRVHLTGVGFFAVGAVLAASAGSFAVLLMARVVMAVGSALAESVGTGILVSVFGDEERGKAIAAQTSSVAVGAAIGPLVAGLALGVVSWRVLFALMAGLTVVSFAISWWVLDEGRISRIAVERRPVDWFGSVGSAVLIVLVVVTLNNPFDLAWISPPVLITLVAIVVGTVAFIRWELNQTDPMMQLRLFASRAFGVGAAVRILGFMATVGVSLLLPILLVTVRGFSESEAGFVAFLNSAGLGLSAQIAGRVNDRLGSRWLMAGGLVIVGLAMLAFAGLTLATPLWVIAMLSLITGLGWGTWNVPNNTAIISAAPPSSYGVVGALTNLTRTLGGTFGQAIAAAVVAAVLVSRGVDVPLGELGSVDGGDVAFLAGWRVAFLTLAAVAAVAAVLAATIPPEPSRRPAPQAPATQGPATTPS